MKFEADVRTEYEKARALRPKDTGVSESFEGVLASTLTFSTVYLVLYIHRTLFRLTSSGLC